MNSINRRKFLKTTSGIVALAALDLNCASLHEESASAPMPMPAPRGPNERINVAVIGVGGRGVGHLNQFSAKGNCQITYVCDADSDKAQAAINRATTSNGGTAPQFVQDMRRIFDDKSVDAVSIATPNHWHSLAAIWAMQAGKDVYVEKPLSHNLSEGRRVVEVAQRTNRVCQVGTQMRSNPGIIDAIAYLRSGALGKVLVSRGLCYKARPTIGKVDGPQPPPSTVDYNLWCGPAPMSPLTRGKLHYDWHWAWDTGNGDIGNQGIHEIDLARWALGIDGMPKSVQSAGGRFGYVDDGQTPNTQVAYFEYGPNQPKLVIEVRGLNTRAYSSRGVENVVTCEKGYLVSPSYTSAIAYDPEGKVLKTFDGGGDANHFGNFQETVRSRQVKNLNCSALEGHLSDVLLHMANVSFQVGKSAPFEPAKPDALGSDPVAVDAMTRMTQHLSENSISLSSTNFTLGRKLQFNAKSETFDDAQANKLLTRNYRKPFAVPDRA